MDAQDKLLYIYEIGYRISKKGEIINPKGKIIKGSKNKENRIYINQRIKNYFIRVSAHRLQAYQKFGNIIFDKKIVVRHLNGLPSDNSFLNIEIGSQSENMMDRPIDIRIAHSKHASSFIQKYNHDEIVEFYNNCRSYKKTKLKFNISSNGTLNHILTKFKITPLKNFSMVTKEDVLNNKQKFLNRIIFIENSDCFTIKGYKDSKGYTSFQFTDKGVKKNIIGHRASYIIHNEESLLTNDIIVQTCNNTYCVNPNHLMKKIIN